MNNLARQQERKPDSPKQKPWTKIKIPATAEGRIFVAGLVITIVSFMSLGLAMIWAPDTSRIIGVMTVTNIIFGRAASMSLGYAVGLGHNPVIPVNMFAETIMVLLVYPLFVFSLQRLLIFPALKNFMDRTQKAAEIHRDKIRRYGIIGLFVFVWFPFWMTGPVVGAAIGHLLGLRPWINLSVVLTGTYLAIVGWALLLHDLLERAASVGSYAPVILVIIIISAAVIGYALSRTRHKDDIE